MENQGKKMITVEATIAAPATKVWEYWTKPEHITKWNSASDDWHTPTATNDVRPGGKFSSRMEAKDGSMGFDFGGTHDAVIENEYLESTMGDGRKMNVRFSGEGQTTRVVENFEPENENSLELQQGGWQAILNNFKKYTENN